MVLFNAFVITKKHDIIKKKQKKHGAYIVIDGKTW